MESDLVISNATPEVTFHSLLSQEAQGQLPKSFRYKGPFFLSKRSAHDCIGVCVRFVSRQQLKHYDYTSPVMKINIALNQIPNFTCLPNKEPGVGASPLPFRGIVSILLLAARPGGNIRYVYAPPPPAGPQHRCTIHLGAESMEDIETAYQDALQVTLRSFHQRESREQRVLTHFFLFWCGGLQGMPSRKPVIEMTIPSSLDPTLAPKGHHVSSLFVQYAPYHIRVRECVFFSCRRSLPVQLAPSEIS
jgi:hypothetical protein